MKLLNFFKKLMKGSYFIGFFLVGLGFVVFNMMPYIWPEKFIDETNNPTMSIVFAAVGAAAMIYSAVMLKKVYSKSVDEMNYFDKVDMENVSEEKIQEVADSDEPEQDYLFHFCGKLNQSYIMETPDRKPVFEMNCDEINLLTDYVYTFKSHVTQDQFTSKISHTVTTEYSSGNTSLIDQSYFKIDGMNIWDYIGQKGYSIEPYLDGLGWSYKVSHYGYHVADILKAGRNVLEKYEGEEGLSNLPMSGLYRISCRESDVDAVAMIAFAVSRVEII